MLLSAVFFFIRKRTAAGAAATPVMESGSSGDAGSATAAVQLEAGLQLLEAAVALPGAGAASRAARTKLIRTRDAAELEEPSRAGAAAGEKQALARQQAQRLQVQRRRA